MTRAAKKKAKRAPPKRGRGQPTLYREEYAARAYKLALLGMTDAELAEQFGVDERTVNNWKQRHKEFFQSIQRGRDDADADVAVGLYKRATGFTRKIVKTVTDPQHPEKSIVQVTEEEVPPDLVANERWLRNRQQKRWKSDPAGELGNAVGQGLAAIFQSIDGGTRTIGAGEFSGEE